MTTGYIVEIQPTMQRTIQWLVDLGFFPTDSGDGVLNVQAGMEGALDVPHVFMLVSPNEKILEEADRLYEKCRERRLTSDWSVETSYNPADGAVVLALYGVTDADLRAE